MKKFYVNMEGENGSDIHFVVMANNVDQAIRKVRCSESFSDFEKNVLDVKSVVVVPENLRSIENCRFYVTNDHGKEGHYIATDLRNGIKVSFKRGCYEKSKSVIYDRDKLCDYTKNDVVNEIGEFVKEYFSNIY